MNFSELIELKNKTGQPFHEIVLISQMMENGSDPNIVREKITFLLKTMFEVCEKNYAKRHRTLTGLCGGNAELLSQYEPHMIGKFAHVAMITALSVSEANASMCKIVACPTAGSCGVVPGVLFALKMVEDFPDNVLIDSLIVAGAVGDEIARVVSTSGAVAGCQAEIGTAAAMASAVAVYSFSNDAEKVSHAAALVLKSMMGLVCDPVGGFVEVPCIKRNAVAVNIAIACAEMALCGIKSIIPFDEVVEAMAKVGRSIPEELRETGLGGIASTETAKSILEKIRSDLNEETYEH
ncbi:MULTISPECIES: L-serine ammonia-lyase, iron-sulfur-dependent, subunit beta [Pseudothermotoga]|jgi:L-serine dehydratase|uniref:L-serine ammonia-lyase n=1 Tax=Pseudothermotoga lettingae (strain ATCC BAA-301 / DSM 14385 / NBRC 107922 / TMO) TaxID=416591 RepID=A8F8L4_PSELT|nr:MULTISPECIES: L-serine ammonia-lyase, iron-sulfur-dependent, subunit alpha [Pseudothermotoga]ABV34498.1 L-serine dehydratase, iron-sulfur-dependent, alpha subunit [Pseudothermotoga lettingae TMO]KUK21222.1 MAG: L-serine dehydratase, iron-sulfur-dependent, alpha subunit [Pseudothermotoga lettingae]MDI3494566.1 L-serine dehydratase [Pseudothermotoga sp.]MDK2883557.1 L-serine dehydratase [Pseudothermotoga sp.]GLI48556.1 L-serine dehydratase, iron-sulfur-dependent subunit alpha [Pseudothermotog